MNSIVCIGVSVGIIIFKSTINVVTSLCFFVIISNVHAVWLTGSHRYVINIRSGAIEWSKVRGAVTVLYVFFFFAIKSNIKEKLYYVYIKVLFIININNKNNHCYYFSLPCYCTINIESDTER